MKTSTSEYQSIKKALRYWKEQNLISTQQEQQLSGSIKQVSFDWRNFTMYIYLASISCLIIALTGLFNLKAFIAVWKKIDQAIRLGILATIGTMSYCTAIYLRRNHQLHRFKYEAIMSIALFFTIATWLQLGANLKLSAIQWRDLLLFSSVFSAVVGSLTQSRIIWLHGLLSLGVWLESSVFYLPGSYSIAMSNPAKFILLGIALASIAMIFKKINPTIADLSGTTLATGLSYTFIAFWILSIYGSSKMMTYLAISATSWSIIFAAVCFGAIYLGIYCHSNMLKNFGATFLLILLYTKYFEYAWWFPSPLFFGILALSLWILGYNTEKLFCFKLSQKNNPELQNSADKNNP